MTWYMRTSLILSLGALGLAGCSSIVSQTRSDASHPADPRAPAAPIAESLMRLGPDDYDSPLVELSQERERDGSAAPKGGGADSTPMHDHGMNTGGAMKPSGASSPTRAESSKTHPQQGTQEVYACPMHAEVTDSKPSKCPKCGMTLVRRRAGR